MFDPFKDFEEKGYLQNRFGEKDANVVREMEHELFRANLDEAISYLAKQRPISYADFLAVHKILFTAFYPWAGFDRTTTAPALAIRKGGVLFSHPGSCKLAVEHALRLAQDANVMRNKPGEIMGLFAYGHPFLDGNGRTMLIVHSELCNRAGFSITWEKSNKDSYLIELTKEIANPGKGILDAYLKPLISGAVTKDFWKRTIHDLPGLNGRSTELRIEGDTSDPAIAKRYEELEAQRAYRIG